MSQQTLFALNRKTKTVAAIAFSHWEELQSAFQFGIQLPDGTMANGSGRCPSAEFASRAIAGNWTILEY